MNIASIDIGSNTVLLLIAKIGSTNLEPILNRYESPRLGKGLLPNGNIREENLKHLFRVLDSYKNDIETFNCSKIIISATNAMRIAKNAADIVSKIKSVFNFDVNIISGEEEAELSFLGASSSLPKLEDKVVIDIGGGSTEIIYGNRENIFFKHSFQTGVVSLTENSLCSFPYTDKALLSTKELLNEIFLKLNDNIPKNIPTIAVAGTPTTLACIKQNIKIYNEEKIESSILTNIDLNELKKDLKCKSGSEILATYGQVVSGREDVLFAGTLILNHLAEVLNLDRIYVSSRGLRYGNIINYLKLSKIE